MKRAVAYKYRCGKCGRGFAKQADLTKHKYRDKCKEPIKPGTKSVRRKCKNIRCKRIFHHKKAFMKHKR